MKKRININATTDKIYSLDYENGVFYSIIKKRTPGTDNWHYAGVMVDSDEVKDPGIYGDYLVIYRVYDPECEESFPTIVYSDLSETCAKSIARHNNKNKNNSGIWYSCSEDGFVDKHIPGCYR